jgi:hypothetical protein
VGVGVAIGFGAAVGKFDALGLTTRILEVFVLLVSDGTIAPAPTNAATDAPIFRTVEDVMIGTDLPIPAPVITR